MRTDAQKRARNKYEAKTYALIACKVKKETLEHFKQYATRHGETVNGLLTAFVNKCLQEDEQNAAGDG